MKIVNVHADNGECTVVTDEGRFIRWPGRQLNGHAWWAWTPNAGHPVSVVTVPATGRALEVLHRKALAPVRSLRVVQGAA